MLVMVELFIPSVTVIACDVLATLIGCGPNDSEAGLATSVVLQMTVELTVALLLVSSGSRKFVVVVKSAVAVLPTVVPQPALGSSVPVMLYVIDPFAGSVTFDVLILPLPDASQLAPALAVQVHAAAVIEDGRRSTTEGESDPLNVLLPLFVTVTL